MKYTLQPYAGPASRYTCPACGKKKCFTRYIDTATGQQLAEDTGKCDRLSNCGYHRTPSQHFAANGNSNISPQRIIRKQVASTQQWPSCMPLPALWHSLYLGAPNHFIDFLMKKFGAPTTSHLIGEYFIGTSVRWQGATVFWQWSADGDLRAAKIMLYDAVTGKRVKEPYNHVAWMHHEKDREGRPVYPGFRLKQCFFGEHLLEKYPEKYVAIVESEKTAVIASVYFPDMIWLAAGGLEGLNEEKCKVLQDRNVILFPDKGAYDAWLAKGKLLLPRFHISDKLEKDDSIGEGADVADG